MTEKDEYGFDDIDREILQLLVEDPRMPYSEIAKRLGETGYDMSSEGVRHRVTDLLEGSSIFLLAGPAGHDWEVIRLHARVTDAPNAKGRAFEELSELDFWLVCRGIGGCDIHAVATVTSVREADELVAQVRGLDPIAEVDYFLETDRVTDMRKYLGSMHSPRS